MKLFKILGVAALAFALATPAIAATPTAITTSTQTPAAAATPNNVVAKQVGTSANFLKMFAAGTCLVDPASINECQSAVYSCSVPGAATTDAAMVQMVYPNPATTTAHATRDCAIVQGAAVSAADTVSFRLVNNSCGVTAVPCDMPATYFNYIVLRPNADAD